MLLPSRSWSARTPRWTSCTPPPSSLRKRHTRTTWSRSACAPSAPSWTRSAARRTPLGGAAHGHRAQPREHRARGERPARPVGPRESLTAQIAAKHARIEELAAHAAELGEGASRLPRAGGGACPHGRRGRQRGRGSAREGSAGGLRRGGLPRGRERDKRGPCRAG